MLIFNLIRGFCMALADSVPGVSGGTVAFILGFYDKFIGSIRDLLSVKTTKEEKKEALIFLIKIGIGWVIGFLLAVSFISSIFEKHIYNISSLFVGFIIFAIPIIIKEEKESLKGKYKNLLFMIIGIAVVVLISVLKPANSAITDLAWKNINIGSCIFVFFVGMIAISAMVLPGISGSTLLLIFGLYAPIINAIRQVMHFKLEYLPILIIFGLGVITGMVSVVKFINYSLKRFRSQTIYLVLGLMIGSLYSVFVGPTTLETPVAAMNIHTFSIIFFIIGGALIIGLERLKYVLEKKENK